jgi:hypothetical protein
MTQIEFEQIVRKVSEINNKLRLKGFETREIDAFWTKIFRLMPIISLIGIDNIRVCTGCGRLDIEPPLPPTGKACCPDSNYKPIKQ